MYVKPNPGKRVRRPDTLAYLPDGESSLVPDIKYWRDRVKAGDVEEVEPPRVPNPNDSVAAAAPAPAVRKE